MTLSTTLKHRAIKAFLAHYANVRTFGLTAVMFSAQVTGRPHGTAADARHE